MLTSVARKDCLRAKSEVEDILKDPEIGKSDRRQLTERLKRIKAVIKEMDRLDKEMQKSRREEIRRRRAEMEI